MSTPSIPGDPAAVPLPTDDARAADREVTDDGTVVPTGPVRSRPRPRRSTVVLSAALTLAVLSAAGGFAWLSSQLSASRSEIDDQQRRLQEQQREIDEQRELIERKEQFGAAMADLYETIDPLIGLPYDTLVPWREIEAFAGRAWEHRWTPVALNRDVSDVQAFTARLTGRIEAARAQATTNASGSAWEATLDELGRGWVSMSFDETGRPCGLEAMACVSQASPFDVHVNADTRTDTTLTDWIRTGVAHHEYAHVLQFTNPGPTASALAAFSGDLETMADCYALTVLDGWSLDHGVPIDDFSYWEVSVGYGQTCDDGQKQVIRDWLAGLGAQKRPVGA